MEQRIVGGGEQAEFLAGDLTVAFLGEAGAESVGATGTEAAAFPTFNRQCLRISLRVCPSRNCTTFLDFC